MSPSPPPLSLLPHPALAAGARAPWLSRVSLSRAQYHRSPLRLSRGCWLSSSVRADSQRTCSVWVGCLDELFMCLSATEPFHLAASSLHAFMVRMMLCTLFLPPCISPSLLPSLLSRDVVYILQCAFAALRTRWRRMCVRALQCVCTQACFWVPEAESCCHWELLMVSHWLWAPLLAAL